MKKRQKQLERLQRKKLRDEKKAYELSTKNDIIDLEEKPQGDQIKKYKAKDLEKIREITKRAEVNISRWYLESARSLLVEWLAIKKDDKVLNFLLGDIYEREKNYPNAIYVYKDMLEIYGSEWIILEKLAYAFALNGDNKESFDVYERALKKDRTNNDILDTLAHLALELHDYKKWLRYSNLYLKEKPRDAEKLWIKWYCLEKLGETGEALEAYQKILQLQPYNSEVQERIELLTA